MTHNILQTDIDFARRMLAENYPDAEIATALGFRGIDSTRAVGLIEDLRLGRAVEPDPLAAFERQATSAESQALQGVSAHVDAPLNRPHRKHHGTSASSPRSKSSGILRFLLLVVVVLAVGTVALTLMKRSRRSNADQAGLKQEPAPSLLSPAAVVIEVQPDSLLIGGKPITKDNARMVLWELLGPPPRTNRVEETNSTQLIYEYDRHGLQIYSQPDAAVDYVLVHLDAVGGASGTTVAFPGTFKIGGQIITSDTDAKTLMGIDGLVFDDPQAPLLRTKYHQLELFFAYLKSRQELSLIEINLKP